MPLAVRGFLPWRLWRFLEDAHLAVPGLFLLAGVGMVAMYGAEIRVPRMRRHGLERPDDPDLGRPSH